MPISAWGMQGNFDREGDTLQNLSTLCRCWREGRKRRALCHPPAAENISAGSAILFLPLFLKPIKIFPVSNAMPRKTTTTTVVKFPRLSYLWQRILPSSPQELWSLILHMSWLSIWYMDPSSFTSISRIRTLGRETRTHRAPIRAGCFVTFLPSFITC